MPVRAADDRPPRELMRNRGPWRSLHVAVPEHGLRILTDDNLRAFAHVVREGPGFGSWPRVVATDGIAGTLRSFSPPMDG